MWATAVKEHDLKIAQRAIISDKHQILMDQVEIKFGLSARTKKKILTTTNPDKLDKALKRFATAVTCDEVLKCLD